jgi:hypothetical protein
MAEEALRVLGRDSVERWPERFMRGLARDMRILTEGGYDLQRITPVDQFLWSPHLELAPFFRR